jgi:hypothetical protein
MPIGWIGVPVVMAVGSWLFISPILGQLKCGDARILSLCLQELKGEDMMQRMRMNWSPRMGAQHDAFEVYVSGRFHPALTSERTWSNAMFVGLRPIAQTALRDHPQASSDELARATAIVQPLLDDYLKGDRQQLESVRKLGTAGGLIATPYWVLVPIAFLSILLSVFRPGGLVLDFAGATVVNRQGESISRGRSLLRAIITWSPVLVVAIGVPAGLFGQSLRGAGIAGAAAMAIMLIGAAFAIVTPERGIQDRLAGTYLVPR